MTKDESYQAIALAILIGLCCSSAVTSPQLVLAQTADGRRSSEDYIAHMRYEAAVAKYNAGLFTEAAHEFEAAYAASHRAELLYNIYLAWRDAGDQPAAASALRRYLPNVSDRATRTRLGATLRALETRMRQAQSGRVESQPSQAQEPRTDLTATVEVDSETQRSAEVSNTPTTSETPASTPTQTNPQRRHTSSTSRHSNSNVEADGTQTPSGNPSTVVGRSRSTQDARTEGALNLTTAEDSSASPRRSRTWGRVLVASGAILIGAGATAGIVAWRARHDLRVACPDHECEGNSWRSDLQRRRRSAITGDVLGAIGIAGTILGAITLVRSSHASQQSLSLACGWTSCTVVSTRVF